MMEVYVLVERKKPFIISAFGIISFIVGGISALASLIGLFVFLPAAVLGLVFGYLFYTRNVEFEYSFFDDDVRFAKIINKSKRKKLPGYKMSEVVAIAPTGDHSVYQYENDKSAKIRRLHSGNADAKVYVMVVRAGSQVELVYFEPDDKYLDAVCMKNGHKVRK